MKDTHFPVHGTKLRNTAFNSCTNLELLPLAVKSPFPPANRYRPRRGLCVLVKSLSPSSLIRLLKGGPRVRQPLKAFL